MKRADLVLALSDRLGVPEHSAQVFLHAFFDSAKAALRTGDPLRFENIGTWTPTLHPDGTLQSVSFSASHIADRAQVPASGPASSIDAMHFIPAAALERVHVHPSECMVDIADVVDEVHKAFHPERSNGEGTRPEAVDSDDSDAPATEAAAVVDDDTVMDAPEAVVDDDQDLADTHDFERVYDEDVLDLSETDTGDVDDFTETDAADRVHDEESVNTVEAEIGEDDGGSDHAQPVAAELTQTSSEDAAEGEEDDEEDDDAVFYRNRDQLYNPPEERNKRPLLIVALLLTAAMIVIILSIVFGDEERPAVPGSSSGQTPTCLRHDVGAAA